MFIQTELTPNPNAIKFILGSDVAPSPIHFSNAEESKNIRLVMKLFKIDGVAAVFYGSDFITITKSEEDAWEPIKPFIISAIMDHITTGLHPMDGYQNQTDEIDTSHFSDIEKQIIEIIETRVRPSVAMDGGDITYKGFEEGIVYLELKGSCSGCPSSTITLKNGIESMLQYYVPEVISVEAINGE
jgi:Fe-S cluster biogenesis protein NfuA